VSAARGCGSSQRAEISARRDVGNSGKREKMEIGRHCLARA